MSEVSNYTTKKKVTLVKTLKHWITWNSFVETYAQHRVKLEEIDSNQDKFSKILCSNLHLSRCPKMSELMAGASKISTSANHNHTHHAVGYAINWTVLEAFDPTSAVIAQLMAARYGYEYSTDAGGAANLPGPGLSQFCDFSGYGHWRCALRCA